jgi:drug/metabolite transporter (DMT)-like permease
MDLWIWITLAAAAFQTLRFTLQKVLRAGTLSTFGATFARFAYSAPLIAAGLAGYLWASAQALPPLGAAFWAYALAGGAAQVLATACVVALFGARNFAVGITFKKTEVVQTALMGFVLLGEGVSAPALGAIALGLVGVWLLGAAPGEALRGLARVTNRAAGLGLGAGFLFAISAVCYRGASLEVASEDPLLRAGVTLAAVTAAQMAGLALWLRLREPGEIARVWAARRVALWVGLASMGGSFCWFLAFTLQTAALVKAVGQIELLMSLAVTVLVFREPVSHTELAGIALLSASVVALVLVT